MLTKKKLKKTKQKNIICINQLKILLILYHFRVISERRIRIPEKKPKKHD